MMVDEDEDEDEEEDEDEDADEDHDHDHDVKNILSPRVLLAISILFGSCLEIDSAMAAREDLIESHQNVTKISTGSLQLVNVYRRYVC